MLDLLLQFFLRIPALGTAFFLTIYWGWVLVKLVRLARKIGKDPNAMPREPVGQAMRVLWYPAILVMLVAAWMGSVQSDAVRVGQRLPGVLGWFQPQLARASLWELPAVLGACIVFFGTAYTFVCWARMGRSWRIGIDPKEKLDLVSTGPYRYVRHPIYAIRMVIDLAACLAIPSPLLAITALIDILLLQIEARREERYMEATHGEAYRAYKKNVGRFVPRGRLV